jgi:hypothetical protein
MLIPSVGAAVIGSALGYTDFAGPGSATTPVLLGEPLPLRNPHGTTS